MRESSGLHEELARKANVPVEFVERLFSLELIDEDGAPRQLGRIRLLHAWLAAGYSLEMIATVTQRGELLLSFLDAAGSEPPGRLDLSYAQWCEQKLIPFSLVQAVHTSLGFEPPQPTDRVRDDDEPLMELAGIFTNIGAPEEAVLRLFSLYTESMRRFAKAESEFFEANVEARLRKSGLSERELMEFGNALGERINKVRSQVILTLYRRHFEHVWIEHALGHVDAAMEKTGLKHHVENPPAICFVDLAGYTRLTEEQGDAKSAEVAGKLAALVKDIARRRRGRPVRWLGDGGMFYFKDPGDAVEAGLEMVETAPTLGLPQAHVGIFTGPVISQDGDIYGRTVNLSARLSSYAQAGEVIVTKETVLRSEGRPLRFEARGDVALKGVAAPLPLFEAHRL